MNFKWQLQPHKRRGHRIFLSNSRRPVEVLWWAGGEMCDETVRDMMLLHRHTGSLKGWITETPEDALETKTQDSFIDLSKDHLWHLTYKFQFKLRLEYRCPRASSLASCLWFLKPVAIIFFVRLEDITVHHWIPSATTAASRPRTPRQQVYLAIFLSTFKQALFPIGQ